MFTKYGKIIPVIIQLYHQKVVAYAFDWTVNVIYTSGKTKALRWHQTAEM